MRAEGHYNDNVIRSLPADVSRNTEVWFDLVPNQDGVAEDETTVLFVPVDGDGRMSVVIHVGNAETGGVRQACLPLDVSKIFPAKVPSPTG
jgi:hypothetical protein